MAQVYERIFVALDGQKSQEEVARRGVLMASENHATLKFGHVVDAVPTEVSAVDFNDLCNEFKQQIETDLADVLKEAREDAGIPEVQLEVVAGSITDAMDKRLIAPFDPDLVICGERGLSNIKYAFVGSVSTHLIRTLDCDVLVVKQH